MKPIRHTENLVRRLDVESAPETRERTLADVVTAHAGKASITRHTRPWIRDAAVASLVLLGLLGIIVLHESAAPVYAVEQTVAAIRKVPVVHIFGRDWDDRRLEIWIKVNPETGLMDSCHIRYLDNDRFILSTPTNTYDCDGKANTVHIKDGPSITSIFNLADFFQGMTQLAKTLDGQITCCEVTDPSAKRAMLELKLSAPRTEVVCLIDPQTKLPIGISVTRGGRFGSSEMIKSAAEIRYGDTPPAGLFDFSIPAGANVSVETVDDPLQNLPASVLRHCGEYHLRTVQKLGKPQSIPVNTRMYFVDSEFNLRDGAFVGVCNDSSEVWQGEIGVFNVDPPHMALFDAATGKKQQIRLVQHRQSPPGRFRVYWQLQEPLPPGQTRYGIYWRTDARKLADSAETGSHPLVMDNFFGAEAVENFLLIIPKEMEIHDASRASDSNADVDGYAIHVWQRHLPPEKIVNRVDVVLSRPSSGWPGRDPGRVLRPSDRTDGAGSETSDPLEKAISVRDWEPDEKVELYTITMDDPNEPNMIQLRTKYALGELVRGSADDYEKLRRLLAWVQKRWEHNGSNSPSRPDPLTILKEVSEGKRFRCVEYANVVAGCARSLGMPSRRLGLMRSDVETAESGAGHVVAEVWLRQFDKWVMVDGQWGAIGESQGVPLNAVELQDAIARKDPGLTIRFVSPGSEARQGSYIKWIVPYLYYLNFDCDQRFYPSRAQVPPTRRGPIILVPKGAPKPQAFQRHKSFQGATYISNPRAFYPSMDDAAASRPYLFNTRVTAALDNDDEIRLDCPSNPFGLQQYRIYCHVDKDGGRYVGIRAVFADGRQAQSEVAAANCDCILQQPRQASYLGILEWQLNDDRLDVSFRTSDDKEQNLCTCRRFAADGKRVCEQYGNRRLILPDCINRREAMQDVDFLVLQLKAKHPKPFAKVSERDFAAEAEQLKASLSESVRIADLSLSISALLALVRDDHTVHRDFSVFDEHVAGGGKVFPVKLRYKNGQMTVDARSPEISRSRVQQGDIVRAVNGRDMGELLHRYGRYMSLETDTQKWWTLEWAIEEYQVLLGDADDRYELGMQDGEGRVYSETLPAVKPWLEQYDKSRPRSPRFHHQFYECGKACLFKLQTFNWNLRAELEAKTDALVSEMRQNGTEIAILDLRGNGGGNSNMGTLVFTKMIDKPYAEWRPDPDHSWPVRMALLCDRGTYSAASFMAMCFKDHDMGIIAGEETGGRASFFGDIEHITLPNSLLVCGIATRYFPRRAGYDDGRGVLPDLALDVTLDDAVLVERIGAFLRDDESRAGQ